MLVDGWFMSVQVICCSTGGLGVEIHSFFVFLSWAGWGGAGLITGTGCLSGLAWFSPGRCVAFWQVWEAAFWQDL